MRNTPPFPSRFPARLLVFALVHVLAAGSACAATNEERINELERKLQESLKQINELQKELQQLKSESGNTAAPAATTAPVSNEALVKKVDDLEQQLSAIANQPEEDRGLDMHGFADVGFSAAGQGHPTGANIGNVDFYLTPRFSDRVKSLFELNFECCDNGSITTDLERMQIGYTVSDWLTLWAGRFHTPFGYWNTAFHHGAQLQTTILRPQFLEFEDSGGILPAHTVGLWATGAARTLGGRFGYDFYVGNAPTIKLADPNVAGTGTLDPGLAGAGGRAPTFGGNLHYSFGGPLQGLSIGAHALTSKVVDSATTPDWTRLNMFGPWFTYLEGSWEVLGEQYTFRNRDLNGNTGSHSSNAGYAQVGRQFGLWTPYVRYETASLDQTDAYFAQQQQGRSYRRLVSGLRYDLNPRTAFKLEAQRTRLTDRDLSDFNELLGQLAIRF
jgi:hypothetical protein